MNTKKPDLPEWGSFALVAYIPHPLGAFLDSLRTEMPGEEFPQAHITVLPPRPLKSRLESALAYAKRILMDFQPITAGLSAVKVFPETNLLYLDIEPGSDELHKLHDALNTGELAHEENFEFLPHLTISGPIPLEHLAKLRDEANRRWELYPESRTVEINEVVALWQPVNGSWDDWNRVWVQKLGDVGNSEQAGS